ncbi:hypothetical protein GE21DRAFT_1307061 [Neurospora crassa]|nr:hypothetical protein B24B19.120 [imported] - Neurospora crassa [Neurospora crassa]KHE86318.1 hypothetical protein GE21DRAFT_1307061 [Neurospora crassa]
MEMFEIQQKPAFLPLDYHLDARHCSAVLCKKLRYHVGIRGRISNCTLRAKKIPLCSRFRSRQFQIFINPVSQRTATIEAHPPTVSLLALENSQSTDVDSSVPGRFNYLF